LIIMSNSIAKRLADELRGRVGQGADRVEVVADGATVTVDVEASERYAVGGRAGGAGR
jgi:predicted neutral ceramidase superfamily lipid hydrolase